MTIKKFSNKQECDARKLSIIGDSAADIYEDFNYDVLDIESLPKQLEDTQDQVDILSKLFSFLLSKHHKQPITVMRRLYSLVYIIKPALIDGMTLDQLGQMLGCTRQAMSRWVVSFEDETDIQSRNGHSKEVRKRLKDIPKRKNKPYC